ncbi:unnamed protein product [Rotaria sp. Silwood1]|nr:unnamed protein product [Rotaria sp. Silwood1]
MAATDSEHSSLFSLTDCIYFANGNCMFKRKCNYRHCQIAMKQLEECSKWPDTCRNIDCPYRHTGQRFKTQKSPVKEKGRVSFFWDIENVPIPKGQKPFDIIQRIRDRLVVQPGLQEAEFSCFCDTTTISHENRLSLHHANVDNINVPNGKPGAVDLKILLALDRFERNYRPPATVVLISGDIDFVGKLNDLRHRVGFHVIVIHNKQVKPELKATVNAHYPWELFIESVQQQKPNKKNRPRNQSKECQVVSNGQVNNNTEVEQKPAPKSRQSRLAAKFHLNDENNRRQNDFLYLKPPATHERFRSTSQNHGRRSRSLSRKPQTFESVNQIPIFNGDDNTSRPGSNSVVAPRAQLRQGTSINRLHQKNISRFPPCEQIPSAVSADTAKKEHNPVSCPHCTNEFSTIQKLRQHQKDKKHLFYCSICNGGFSTPYGLKQHQTAKGHDTSMNISNEDKLQSNINDNLNVHELITLFEDKLNMCNDKKRFPVYRKPVINKENIDININNVNDKN